MNHLIQCTYCVHTCFHIVLIFDKIAICSYCNYNYNYIVDPSLTP